jgi:hypothetical protein
MPPEVPAAGAPNALDEPVVAAPPNVGVLAPELVAPKMLGAGPPDVPLLTAPNKGLFAPSLFCCPKPPKVAMVRGYAGAKGAWRCCGLSARAVYAARRGGGCAIGTGESCYANRTRIEKAQSQKSKSGNDGSAHVFLVASVSRLPKVGQTAAWVLGEALFRCCAWLAHDQTAVPAIVRA